MKRYVNFFAGCIFTIILMTTMNVFADSLTKIDVIFGKVKLMVQGVSSNKETILYNGTTYVPLRDVAEMLNQDVAYDSKISIAYIDSKGINRQDKIDKLHNSNKKIEYYYGWENVPNFDTYSGIRGIYIEGQGGGTDWTYTIYGYEYNIVSDLMLTDYENLLIAQGFVPIEFENYNNDEERQIKGAYKRNNIVIILEQSNMVMNLDFFVKVVNSDKTDPFHLRSLFVK